MYGVLAVALSGSFELRLLGLISLRGENSGLLRKEKEMLLLEEQLIIKFHPTDRMLHSSGLLNRPHIICLDIDRKHTPSLCPSHHRTLYSTPKIPPSHPYALCNLLPIRLAVRNAIFPLGCGSWKLMAFSTSSLDGVNCHTDPYSFSTAKPVEAMACTKSAQGISPAWSARVGV